MFISCPFSDDKVTTFAISSAVSTVVSDVTSQTLPYGKVTNVVAAQAGKMTAARNQGGRRKGKNTPRKPKARFDPITRKYVPVTDSVVSSSPVTAVPDVATAVPDAVTAPSLTIMNESLIKFNESALSIQNKVQQIDSVLSSLNAAAKSQVTLVKGNYESMMKSKSPVQADKSLASTNIAEHARSLSIKTVSSKAVASTVGTVVHAKAGASHSKISSFHQLGDAMTSASGVVLKQVQKTVPVVVNKSEILIKDLSTSAALKNVPATTATTKISGTNVACGTVHWNQTTTAGPEISTTSLTVPVYITGAISASAWGGELTMARSLNGAALPVILPSRKANAKGQIQQRVLLGNLASTGSAKASSRSASLLKQSVISLPQSIVTMDKTKASLVTSQKDVGKASLAQSHNPGNIVLGQPTSHRLAVDVGSKLSGSIPLPSRQNCGGTSVASTTRVPILVAASRCHALNNNVASREKTPISHDMIIKSASSTESVVLVPSSGSQ